jgi:hypothetical protein
MRLSARAARVALVVAVLSAIAPAAVAEQDERASAYGREGVFELGGGAGFTVATNLREITLAPMFGWFVADDLELTAILSATYIDTGEEATGLIGILVEPSYQLAFNPMTYGFLGMGVGGAYVGDLGGGLALAPRIGARFLVGTSGILTPSLSWQYTTHDLDVMSGATDTALLSVASSLRMNVAYTVMW